MRGRKIDSRQDRRASGPKRIVPFRPKSRDMAPLPDENPNPVLRFSKQGMILYANEASGPLLERWQVCAGEVIGERWREIIERVLDSRQLENAEVCCQAKAFVLSFTPAGAGEYVDVYGLEITDRKRIEESLCRREEHYRSLIENIDLGVTLMDVDHNILFVNMALAKMFDKTPDYFVGKKCFREYEKRQAVCPHCPGVCAMAEGKAALVEMEGVRDDGSHFATRNQAFPLFNADGSSAGFIEIVEDFTEYKKVRQALAQSEEKFRAIFDSSNDGILIVDSGSGKFTLANPKIARMLGYTQDEMAGMSVADIHPEESLPMVREYFAILARGERDFFENVPVKRKDGIILYADIGASPITLPEGDFVVGLFRDVTERNHIQQQIENLARFPSENPNPVLRIGTDGICLYANEACEPFAQKWSLQPGGVVGEYWQSIVTGAFKAGHEQRFELRHEDRIYSFAVTPIEQAGYANLYGRDITERKETEQALQEVNQQLQTSIEQMPTAYILWDTDFHVLEWNRAAERIFGYSRDEAVGKNIADLIVPKNIRHLVDKVMTRLQYNESISYSKKDNNIRKDGTVISCQWHNQALKDKDGNVFAILSIAEDVTEKLADQERLLQSEDRFRRAVLQSPFPIMIHAEDGEVIQINEVWTELTGYTPEDIPTLPAWTQFAYGERKDIARSRIDRIFDCDSRVEEGEYVITTKDGKALVWDFSSAPLQKLPDGRRLVISIARDVTDRKKAKEALQRIEWLLTKKIKSDQEMRYSPTYGNLVDLNTSRILADTIGEKVLTDIVDDYLDLLESSAAVYEKNGDYALGLFASGWCKTLDQASRDLCNTDDNREALTCGKWHCHESCWNEASKAAIETGQMVDIECNGGIRLYAIPIWAEGKVAGAINFGYGDPPRDPQTLQEIAEKYSIDAAELTKQANAYKSRPPFIIDIAKKRLAASANLIGTMIERKFAEQQRQHLTDKLRVTNDELKSVIRVISHDLRSPLVNIQGFSKELIGDCQRLAEITDDPEMPLSIKSQLASLLGEDIPTAIEYITASTSKMNMLLKGLTNLNRVSRAMLSIQKLDMNRMIKSVTDAMKFQIETAGVSVTVDDLPVCLGDSVQTNQVFTNILDNAIKYLNPGRKGMIHISATIDDDRIAYRIGDNGIGIAPEHQSKVFELFHRLDPNGPVAGDGVGLSAVLRILDRQNGQIWIESELGKGTAFFVSLAGA